MSEKKIKPMNLLFFFPDQHSREVLGCYGNPHVHTPNLDKLARNGVIFSNSYCNNPICVPSRAIMTTGDYGFRNHYWDNNHPYAGQIEGWGHRLVEQGYKVATVGKLHYKDNIPETGFPDQRIPLNLKDGVGDYSQTLRNDPSLLRDSMKGHVINAGEGDSEYIQYDLKVAKLAADFLKNDTGNETKPWCLYVGFACPHFPWKVPADIMDLYRPYEKLPIPKQWGKDVRPNHPAIEKFRENFCFDGEITDELMRKAVAAYYGMVTFVDQQVGFVLDALKEAGLEDTTRIIYSSDHGDSIGDHGLFFKHNMYEGSVGVPLILSAPDMPKGKKIDNPASLIDIFPTVIDCMGASFKPEDEKLPGKSLWDFVNGNFAENRTIFSEYHAIGFADATFMVRYKDYKLVYYVNYEKRQLFNLAVDPDEMYDLAGDPSYSDLIKKIETELHKFCDPEEVDKNAKKDQKILMDKYGGREAILNSLSETYFGYSPVPSN